MLSICWGIALLERRSFSSTNTLKMRALTNFSLLKELEKLGPKKGVISQSVKDVIQSLVDDDLALKDKVGSLIYFWSLPNTAGNQLRSVHQKLDSESQNCKKRFSEL